MIAIRFNDEAFTAEFDRVVARLKRPAVLNGTLGGCRERKTSPRTQSGRQECQN